jgi:hypothetical protein
MITLDLDAAVLIAASPDNGVGVHVWIFLKTAGLAAVACC